MIVEDVLLLAFIIDMACHNFLQDLSHCGNKTDWSKVFCCDYGWLFWDWVDVSLLP
jgi:hypothetical protein